MLNFFYFAVFFVVVGLLLLILLPIRREQIKRNKEEGYFIFLFKTGEIGNSKIKWGEIKKIARKKNKEKIKFTLVEFDQKSWGRFRRDFSCWAEFKASTKAAFKE